MGYYVSHIIGIRADHDSTVDQIWSLARAALLKLPKGDREMFEDNLRIDAIPPPSLSHKLDGPRGSYVAISGVFNYWSGDDVDVVCKALSKEFGLVMHMELNEEKWTRRARVWLDGAVSAVDGQVRTKRPAPGRFDACFSQMISVRLGGVFAGSAVPDELVRVVREVIEAEFTAQELERLNAHLRLPPDGGPPPCLSAELEAWKGGRVVLAGAFGNLSGSDVDRVCKALSRIGSVMHMELDEQLWRIRSQVWTDGELDDDGGDPLMRAIDGVA